MIERSATSLLHRDVPWDEYHEIVDEHPRRHLRLSYCERVLEIGGPKSAAHAHASCLLFQMVVELSNVTDTPRASFGDATWERPDLELAIQADESFYLANEPRVRGKDDIDLPVDPPPDLAIEIELSPPLRERLVIYAGLGVPEVWRFDGSTIIGLTLDGESYRPIERSLSFPILRVADVLPFLERRHATEEGALMQEFREWVRAM